MSILAIWLSVAAWGSDDAIFAGVGEPPLGDVLTDETRIAARTKHLASILRCPVCQGMSVADSREGASLSMKARIREMIAAGYSDEQIIAYFVERYGEGIVLLPDQRHWLVWLGPVAIVGIGLMVVAGRMRRQGPGPALPPKTTPTEDDPYRAQVLAELEQQ